MEKYIVSARKYRPASFEDVVGQSAITATLKNSITNNHLGHAYLFSGPRGVGKTTCARIFAKTINCFQPEKAGEACGKCESCLSFAENRSYNIHELDAASNNSVDDIRTLTEQVRIPPQVGSYSIYIIDEVHMLSQSAFNAFLKTLEEPPAHAVFILATTEKHKIIPTILSRCQVFDFNRIRVEDMVDYLKGIAQKQEIECEEDALNVIAQKADGAMRDALSIFDQIVSFSGGKITYQDVIRNLNILDYDYYFKLTESFMENDVPGALLIFDEILSRGFDARNFINGYAAHLRDLMVCRNPETVQLMEVGAGIRDKYLLQSKDLPLPFLYQGLEICNQADLQFRTSRNQRLTIELALVKLANLSGDQKKKQAGEGEAGIKEQGTEGTTGISQKGGEGQRAEQSDVKDAPLDAKQEGGTAPKTVPTVTGRSISIKGSLQGGQEGQRGQERQDSPGKGDINAEKDKAPEAAGEQKPDTGAILEAWDAYAASIEKKWPRIYSTLTSNRPEAGEDGSIRVFLNSEAQRDNFMKNIKPALLDFILKETGLASLEIDTRITEASRDSQKIYTEQDKLDYLLKKNPLLGELKTRLSLDFDH